MSLNLLNAISPVDGRYRDKTKSLSPYFSEFGLMRYRVLVEIEYFIALCEIPLPQLKDVDTNLFPELQAIYTNFSEADAQKIKDIEQVTNHDVKAVEYFIREKFDALQLEQYKEFIHFGLTSQDINNTAIPMSLKDALDEVYFPALENVITKLNALAQEWKNIPMLARTHGQPASPTRLGKEIDVFVERLDYQYEIIDETIEFISGKFGGATGNFNAHHIAYPEIDWVDFANNFLGEKLGICRAQTTTQIDHYDNLAEVCDTLKRINTIFIDLCRDIWSYVSMDYFKQKIKAGEVGSSAMPHKVNPIDFENAEGNLGVANAILEHFSAKLPVSRLQRDLTDSTVLRNIGVPVAHILISLSSISKGLDKLLLNQAAINADLENNWAVVAEGIQTILRREGYPQPYEALKALTRTNEAINEASIKAFINTLNVSDSVKDELRKITPFTYTGI